MHAPLSTRDGRSSPARPEIRTRISHPTPDTSEAISNQQSAIRQSGNQQSAIRQSRIQLLKRARQSGALSSDTRHTERAVFRGRSEWTVNGLRGQRACELHAHSPAAHRLLGKHEQSRGHHEHSHLPPIDSSLSAFSMTIRGAGGCRCVSR